ncbi:MAG: 4-hydroxy-tetrahydrodipicolinate synthase [Candidatus Melainabacteria bacterium GWA2_34_9]|nr:MAG: 4-hydroxy-tetrahydrodipicolinate synthase [Candidatus Melainabacteria bacterium GWA2_34_9]
MRINVGEVITAMVTPFNENFEVNYNEVERLTDYLINNGSDTILVAGTTGECPTLTHEEELEILKVVKNVVGNKAKVVMGTGSNSTRTAVDSTQKAEKAGADAILSVVPYYNKPSQAGLLEHFGQIAKSTSLPIILYNIPGRTGINMEPETVSKLANDYKNIAAVKQSNPNLDLVTEIKIQTPEDFVIYSGDDSLTLPMLSIGAHGVISVASHVIGKDIKQIITEFKAGNISKALEIHLKAYPMFKAIFTSPNPIPIKAVLAKKGLISETVRPPLVKLTASEKEKLYNSIASYNI